MLAYRCAKQHSEPGGKLHGKRSTQADEITLAPLELIDRIAALVPPTRTHRHRYYGVLAPHSPHRAAVVALAAGQTAGAGAAQPEPAQPVATGESADETRGPAPMGHAIAPAPEQVPPKRAAHYLWAVLIARIYQVFPLLCPLCGGQTHIIAVITHSADIRHIVEHIGVAFEPPHIYPARGPPLWESCDALAGEDSQIGSDWGLAAQPTPDCEVDHRVSW
jgi:hypothetical protein